MEESLHEQVDVALRRALAIARRGLKRPHRQATLYLHVLISCYSVRSDGLNALLEEAKRLGISEPKGMRVLQGLDAELMLALDAIRDILSSGPCCDRIAPVYELCRWLSFVIANSDQHRLNEIDAFLYMQASKGVKAMLSARRPLPQLTN